MLTHFVTRCATRAGSYLPVNRSASRQAGFTLTELMLVVGIAAILMGMAIPNFGRFVSRDRVQAAAQDIHSTLTLARQKALARRALYRVRVTADPPALQVERNVDGDWVPDPDEPLVLSETVHLETLFGGVSGNNALEINGQGLLAADDAPAVFTLYNDRADSVIVRMVRTGRIRAQQQ